MYREAIGPVLIKYGNTPAGKNTTQAAASKEKYDLFVILVVLFGVKKLFFERGRRKGADYEEYENKSNFCFYHCAVVVSGRLCTCEKV